MAVLVSVNVGMPRGEQWEGRTVRTGICLHASVRPGDQLNAASPRGESVLLDETCPVLLNTSITPLTERPISTGWREIAGSVVFMFRPAEEAGSGAPLMIRDGVLDAAGTRVEAAYAIHVGPRVSGRPARSWHGHAVKVSARCTVG